MFGRGFLVFSFSLSRRVLEFYVQSSRWEAENINIAESKVTFVAKTTIRE